MHHDAAYDAYRNKLHVLYAFLFSSLCVNICVIFQSFPHTDFTFFLLISENNIICSILLLVYVIGHPFTLVWKIQSLLAS